jgi:hypothetical protein
MIPVCDWDGSEDTQVLTTHVFGLMGASFGIAFCPIVTPSSP